MVNRRLCQELENQNFIHQNQHAFRHGMGIDTYLNHLHEILNTAKTNHHHTDCAVVDLSKAFDCSWRYLILDQLHRWGFQGNLPNFIVDFLQNRTFSVQIGSHTSTVHTLQNGVPQGAILSPILFIIGIESLFLSIPLNITPLIYADDILLISSASTPAESRDNLQAGLNKLAQWCRWTGFQLSPSKCSILHICPRTHDTPTTPLTINNRPVQNSKSARILGVIIDSKQSFSDHFCQLKTSTKHCLNFFKIMGCRRTKASRQTLIRIVHCWLVPKLLHGMVL